MSPVGQVPPCCSTGMDSGYPPIATVPGGAGDGKVRLRTLKTKNDAQKPCPRLIDQAVTKNRR